MTTFSLFSHTAANSIQSGGKVEHIVLRVKGYDLESSPHVVIGERLETGEELRISLDAERVKKAHKTLSKEPPKVEYFAGKGRGSSLQKRQVFEDGFILMNTVFENNGALSAGWATSLSHGAEENKETISVLSCMANLASWVKDGVPNGRVNLVLTNPNYVNGLTPFLKEKLSMKGHPFVPKLYTNLEDVRKYAEILFSRGLGAIIRVRLKDAVEGTYNVIAVDTMRTFGDNIPTPKEWYDQRVAAYLEQDNVRALLNEEKIDIEVIPVLGAILNSNIKGEFDSPRWRSLREKYNQLTSDGVKRLFMPSIVTLYAHPDHGGIFLSSITPQLMSDAYIGMDGLGFYAETEHGKGTDEGVVQSGFNPDDFKIKYVRKQKTEQAHEGSTLAQHANNTGHVNTQETEQSDYNPDPVIDDFDDSIPF